MDQLLSLDYAKFPYRPWIVDEALAAGPGGSHRVTLSFTAPGVGLEPTTYGSTV